MVKRDDSVLRAWQIEQFASIADHLTNWPAISEALLNNKPLPEIEFCNGLIVRNSLYDPTAYVFKEIFVDEIYTRNSFYTPSPGDIVLDCGANVGLFAMYLASREKRLKVFCFEPASETRARLEWNVARNGLSKSIVVYPFALFNDAGSKALNQADLTGSRSFFSAPNTILGETETVETITLSSALDLTKADEVALLKIDIEGAEIEVLESSAGLNWSGVNRVVLEFHNFLRPDSHERTTNALKRYGFLSIETTSSRVFDGIGGTIQAAR